MGKVTLAVLVLAIALGVYWFWWSDQGANDPITVEGTVTVSGLSAIPGLPPALRTQGSIKVDFTLQAVPNKVRISGTANGQTGEVIFRLDKRELYVLDKKNKAYTAVEFDYVDMSETELYEAEETWPKELERTADWSYVGRGESQRFCNRQRVPDLAKLLAKEAKGLEENPLLAMMLAMSKQMKVELWFTPETRLGRRYFSTINKLARMQPVGQGRQLEGLNLNPMMKEKRGQLKYVNLDFFPFPMKADVSVGSLRLELDVRSLSREKVPKKTFEVPSGYGKK